jgi:hypothetical protein
MAPLLPPRSRSRALRASLALLAAAAGLLAAACDAPDRLAAPGDPRLRSAITTPENPYADPDAYQWFDAHRQCFVYGPEWPEDISSCAYSLWSPRIAVTYLSGFYRDSVGYGWAATPFHPMRYYWAQGLYNPPNTTEPIRLAFAPAAGAVRVQMRPYGTYYAALDDESLYDYTIVVHEADGGVQTLPVQRACRREWDDVVNCAGASRFPVSDVGITELEIIPRGTWHLGFSVGVFARKDNAPKVLVACADAGGSTAILRSERVTCTAKLSSGGAFTLTEWRAEPLDDPAHVTVERPGESIPGGGVATWAGRAVVAARVTATVTTAQGVTLTSEPTAFTITPRTFERYTLKPAQEVVDRAREVLTMREPIIQFRDSTTQYTSSADGTLGQYDPRFQYTPPPPVPSGPNMGWLYTLRPVWSAKPPMIYLNPSLYPGDPYYEAQVGGREKGVAIPYCTKADFDKLRAAVETHERGHHAYSQRYFTQTDAEANWERAVYHFGDLSGSNLAALRAAQDTLYQRAWLAPWWKVANDQAHADPANTIDNVHCTVRKPVAPKNEGPTP